MLLWRLDNMQIFLVRHGETNYNVEKKNQGWKDSFLTAKGKDQAFKIGVYLRDKGIEKIYCSDLLRTKQTAKEILKSVFAPIEYVSWLREKNLGEFGGTPEGTMLAFVADNSLDLLSFIPPSGESILNFRKRVIHYFHNFLEMNIQKNKILLVTHGGNITQILLHILKFDEKKYDNYKPRNCAVTLLEIDTNQNIKVTMLNEPIL